MFLFRQHSTLTSWLVPVIFMAYYYHKISSYMKKEENKSANINEVFQKIQKRNRKALKVLLLLILIFVFTATPARTYFYVWSYLSIFEFDSIYELDWKSIRMFEHVTYILTFSNHVVNFIVYACIIVGFRKFLLNLVTFGYWGKREKRRNRQAKSFQKNVVNATTSGS